MFHFEATMLGHLFFGLSLCVYAAIFAVSRRDLPWHLLLLAALGVLFYAADMVTLFIGWEMMGWSSYFILAKTAQQRTLQRYILFNLGGAFALLGAIVLIYAYGGSMLFSAVDVTRIPTEGVSAIAILLLIALFVKSGVMPLHFWVRDSYVEADDLFSAVLSAIISKAGIFLFILFFFKLLRIDMPLMMGVMAWMGVATSIVATFKAIDARELKGLLAYSSIAQLGYIVTVLALSGATALEAALYHTVIHTLVKLLLFVNVAAVIAASGRRTFGELGALIHRTPLLFILLTVGIIALAGMPLLGGFNSKFLIYSALLEADRPLLLAAVLFSSASAFLYCYKLVYGIYLGQPTGSGSPQSISKSYYVPQLFSAAALVLLGFMPALPLSWFSAISVELGGSAVETGSLFELATPFAAFNGAVLMGVFGVLFIGVLLMMLGVGSEARNARDRLDISYCGERPDPSHNLHYGTGMGRELRRIRVIGAMLRRSSASLWERIAAMADESSLMLRTLYGLSAQSVLLLTLLFFTLILLGGGA